MKNWRLRLVWWLILRLAPRAALLEMRKELVAKQRTVEASGDSALARRFGLVLDQLDARLWASRS